ncbi:aldo/keto reductase [Rufibacter roseus]|uniref:Aldo/keto reductase n=1 Tax=Rufibacter roseus TaxID=1567108 RepID=A0ABW2DRU3_9BACT|nr:aldo/keto reductase [Rufibacter roseus]
MKYNQLGKSDLQVSEVSFGCMSLRGSHAENAVLLQQALEAGINFFDTADLYDKGENEVTVGKAFKNNRNKIVLATKVGNQWRPYGSGWDWNPTKKYILEAVDKSLQRLQTDYIDLYQLHGGTIEDPIDETIEAFEILKEAGKIRYYGISSIRPNVIREYVQRSSIVSVMMQYSLLDRRPEEQILDVLAQNNISVLARGSIAQGLLAGKPTKAYLSFSEAEVKKMVNVLEEVSGNLSIDNMSVAIKYVLQHPAVATAVLGVRTQQQLNHAIKAAHEVELGSAALEKLKQVLTGQVYEQHR